MFTYVHTHIHAYMHGHVRHFASAAWPGLSIDPNHTNSDQKGAVVWGSRLCFETRIRAGTSP